MIYAPTIKALTAIALLSLSAVAQDKQAPSKLPMTATEKAILDLTNKARADEKLPALTPNPILFQVARSHSNNMAKQEKMAHELDGKKPTDRVKEAGYPYREMAENVAQGENVGIKEIVDGWLESKGHRENMLKPAFKEIGIGVAKDAKGRMYYTQVFGTPRKD